MILLALLLAQEGVEPWLRDLNNDDPARREAAEAKLIEIGPPALAGLKPLTASSDLEVSTRASRIVETIERNRRRAALLGAVVRVSLDLKQTAFREALAELERRSGFQTWVAPDVEDRPVTLSIKDAPWLEAVSLLCRAHADVRLKDVEWDDEAPGFLKWRADDPARRAHFALARGKATNEPAICDGPFRISIVYVGQTCSTTADRFTLEMRRSYQPNARPVGWAGHVINQLVDDTGLSLTRGEGSSRPPNRYRDCRTYTWLETLPSRDAKACTVRGRARFWFATETAPVRIEQPETRVGSRHEIGEFVVTLDGISVKGDTTTVVMTGTCQNSFPWKGEHGMPQDLVEIRCYDKTGAELHSVSSGGSYTQTSATYNFGYKLREGQSVAAVEVRSWWDFWPVEVPFEFKDVPLPRW